MNRKKLAIRLVSLIISIFFLHSLANTFHWYSSIWYFDMLMHFLGGMWLGLAATYIFLPQTIEFHSIFIILCVVLLVGLGWEVFEVTVDKVITQNTFNMLDTFSDICFDIAGGLCAILYIWKKQPR